MVWNRFLYLLCVCVQHRPEDQSILPSSHWRVFYCTVRYHHHHHRSVIFKHAATANNQATHKHKLRRVYNVGNSHWLLAIACLPLSLYAIMRRCVGLQPVIEHSNSFTLQTFQRTILICGTGKRHRCLGCARDTFITAATERIPNYRRNMHNSNDFVSMSMAWPRKALWRTMCTESGSRHFADPREWSILGLFSLDGLDIVWNYVPGTAAVQRITRQLCVGRMVIKWNRYRTFHAKKKKKK